MRFLLRVMGLLLALAGSSGSWGQAAPARYPSKPIRMVVPAPAGGPSDVVARLLADRLTQALGQQVLVDNRAGAAQTLGTAAVARAEPDGYTVLFTTSTPIVVAPYTRKNLSYDVRRDLVAVSHVGTTPLVLYVNAAVPLTSLKSALADAKARAGGLTYGSYGNGSSAHLLMETMNRQAGVKMVHVPYKGVAPEIQDLVAGQIQLGVADIGVPASFVKAGKLRALAVTGTARARALPDVPTFAEQGITGMEPFSPWWGLFAPAATPKGIVNQLAAETAKIVGTPEFHAQLASLGGEATGTTAARAAELLQAELAQWQKIIADLPADITFD